MVESTGVDVDFAEKMIRNCRTLHSAEFVESGFADRIVGVEMHPENFRYRRNSWNILYFWKWKHIGDICVGISGSILAALLTKVAFKVEFNVESASRCKFC